MSIRYAIVPYTAPLAPACVIGGNFYLDLVEAQWHWAIAAVTAMSLAVSIELGGTYIAKGISTFWNDKDWARVAIAIVAIFGYMYFGISTTWGTSLWPVFVFITLLYFVVASFDTRRDTIREAEKSRKSDIEYTNAQKNLANAETRKIRAQSTLRVPSEYPQSTLSYPQTCEYCGESFKTSQALGSHKKYKHKEKK